MQTNRTIDQATGRAVIVYGPKGSGKTTHAKAIAAHYGKSRIIDDAEWSHAPFPSDALVLLVEAGPLRNCLHIAEACKAAGLNAHPVLGAAGFPTAVEATRGFLPLVTAGASQPPSLEDENQALRDMLEDARAELDMIRQALGVSYEPHQSLRERMLEAAGLRASKDAGNA